MSVDNKFLDKLLYFLSQCEKASQRTCYANKAWFDSDIKDYNSVFCGLCPNFCDMVIRKSEFIHGGKELQLYGGKLTVEDLCGMIPDESEYNRYWYMPFNPFSSYKNFNVDDKYVYYCLHQHGSASMFVRMKILRDDFDKFLTYIFSYLDSDCFNEHNNQRSI